MITYLQLSSTLTLLGYVSGFPTRVNVLLDEQLRVPVKNVTWYMVTIGTQVWNLVEYS